MVNYTTYDSPLGILLLESDGRSLTGLWLDKPSTEPENTDPVLENANRWLDGYFRGEWPQVSFPLAPKGTPFQCLVWRLLMEIPRGAVRTYGDLAREAAQLLGKEKMSAQAVGQAVGANPIAIVIPCHRVVGAGGKLTGYAYGVEKKQWLLQHERN